MATASSAPASWIFRSAPSPRSCAHCSCSWRGSRTPPTSTSPSASSSVTSVSSDWQQQGPGCILTVLDPTVGQRCPALSPALPAVRPNPPQDLTVRRWGEQLHLTWAPPVSWPLPKSYFSLLYRLQYELPNGTQVTTGHPRPTCPGACHPVSSLCCAHPTPCPPCPSPSPSLGSCLHLWAPLRTGTCWGLSNGPSPPRCFSPWGGELSLLAAPPTQHHCPSVLCS